MRRAFFLLVLVSVYLSTSYSWTADEGLRIVYPTNSSIVKNERIRVVGLVKDPSTKNVTCQVKGGEVLGNASIPVNAGGFSVLVSLKKGLNEISISAPSGRAFQKVSVFFSKDEGKAPEGFRRYYSHSPVEGEGQCEDCHNLKGGSPGYQNIIPSATCQTGQCHPKMGKDKFVHGPVGAGTCIVCHNPHGSPNKGMVTRQGGQMCYICHEAEKEKFKGKVVHYPVAEGDCTGCHDPHQSKTKYQLKGASQQALCSTCHDVANRGSHVHTPVKMGECTECHQVHTSPNQKLLNSPREKICVSCHDDIEQGMSKKFVHKPVAQKGCPTCHDPHSSPNVAQLRKPSWKLCAECHEGSNALKAISTAKFSHPPVQKGECTGCHNLHSSDFAKLLKAPMQDICFTCHKELAEKVKTSKFPHGPVMENDCSQCHEVHGSSNPRILKAYFPAEFYVPYKTENYSICFECHNQDIALQPKTKELTNFRNGDRNLHFLHVNKDKRGRSCKACHEVHAGNQKMHIREQVPYGDTWSYPIRYTQTSTGGSCVVGCHKPQSYDRVKPVSY